MEVAEIRGRPDHELLEAAGPRAAGHTLLRGRPVLVHYAIARYGGSGLQLLHVPVGFGEEALMIFSSSESARRYYLAHRSFLREDSGGQWYARACSGGELASLLLGPYEGLEWVLLDSQQGGGSVTAGSSSNMQADLISRERFLDQLLG